MPINYPDGVDTFTEPTLPEDTPLASAGSASRNHTEHHRDLGDAVEALETNAAKKGHDHSGAGGTSHAPKLPQSQTHENADTDNGVNSLHHTLGTDANQAARGNHTHAYAALTGKPIVQCTSSTRPTGEDLTDGLLIYETDTYRLRSWAQYPGEVAPSWHYLLGPLPSCSLRQSAAQQINQGGTLIEWHQEVSDPNQMFNWNTSRTDIFIKESGNWQVSCAIQWDPHIVPDQARAVVQVNGANTYIQNAVFMRGNLYTPGFSQTLGLSGALKLEAGDRLRVWVGFTPGLEVVGAILSYFEPTSAIASRIDLTFFGS